jgi:hypothetical protein
MAKKTHADIMEKLSALKPSEPTQTRGKAARKPAAKKIKVKKAAPPKKPKAAVTPKSPQPAAPPKRDIPSPSLTAFGAPGGAVKVYLGVYESWFQIIRNCNSMVADCNNMLLSNLTSLMNPGKWGRF